MKQHVVGLLVFLVVVASAVMFTWDFLSRSAVQKFFYEPSSCVEQGFGVDCEQGSDEPIPVWEVSRFVTEMRNKENLHRFDSWKEIETNRIRYISATIATKEGVYAINLFPDSVTYWYKPRGYKYSLYTWADHDIDGAVDFGLMGDPTQNHPYRFDAEFKIGMQFQSEYQKLYNRHFARIRNELARRQ
jgi:hypothetical protein